MGDLIVGILLTTGLLFTAVIFITLWKFGRAVQESKKGQTILIRHDHAQGYRPGRWAMLLGVRLINLHSSRAETEAPSRLCYVVKFLDGAIDVWPVYDEAMTYRFAPSIITDKKELELR